MNNATITTTVTIRFAAPGETDRVISIPGVREFTMDKDKDLILVLPEEVEEWAADCMRHRWFTKMAFFSTFSSWKNIKERLVTYRLKLQGAVRQHPNVDIYVNDELIEF